MNKKIYTKPELTVYGNVTNVTKQNNVGGSGSLFNAPPPPLPRR